MTKTSKVLLPQSVIDEQAKDAALKATREANSASIAASVQSVIGEYYTAEKAVSAAQATLNTKLESAYVALADLAHKNDMNPEMCKEVLTAAIEHFYGKGSTSIGLSTAAKLRSQLLRAMHPNVRNNLPGILKAWNGAWDAEGKAKDANKDAATPLRTKFDNRDGALTQALKLAQGKAGSKTGKGKEEPVVITKPSDVVSWVKAHPRQTRKANNGNAKTDGAVTGDARTQAIARVESIITLVKALQDDYPAALDTIQPVLDALAHVTGDRLVPSKPTAPPTTEPVEGAAQLESAIDPKMAAAFTAFMKTYNGGK